MTTFFVATPVEKVLNGFSIVILNIYKIDVIVHEGSRKLCQFLFHFLTYETFFKVGIT